MKVSKLKSFFTSKRIIIGTNFLIGFILGYVLGFYRVHKFFSPPKITFNFDWLEKLINQINYIVPNPSFLSDIAAVEGVLIGVSIPISLQVVSMAVARYRDQELASFFTNEKLYKAQIFLFLPNIVLAIMLKFFFTTNPIILGLILVWFMINVFVFYFFLQMIRRYAVETDKVFIEKLKKYAEKIL